MQLEVLADGQLGIERERLRHVADAPARIDVAGVERLAEQQGLAFARRQQSGEHLHRRGLAAAVGADKAEDLAAFDGEAHPIDGDKVAEAACQVARRDHRLGIDNPVRRDFQLGVPGPDVFRQQGDEGLFDGRGVRLRLQIGRRAGGQDLAVVHGDERIEPLGLFHIGGGDHDAHAGATRPHAVDQLPELPPRQRIDAGRGLVEDQKVGIVDERAAQPEFLPHAARQFLRRTIGEGRKLGALQKLGNSPVPLGTGLPEQPAEKLDILADAEVRIKVLAEPLRHESDARANRGAVRGVCHVAVKHDNAAGLQLPCAGDDAEQRRLADAVGADQPDHAAGRQRHRDVIECRHTAVTLRDVLEPCDGGHDSPAHCPLVPCRDAGQVAAGSVST